VALDQADRLIWKLADAWLAENRPTPAMVCGRIDQFALIGIASRFAALNESTCRCRVGS
jgi:hypothetical protein